MSLGCGDILHDVCMLIKFMTLNTPHFPKNTMGKTRIDSRLAVRKGYKGQEAEEVGVLQKEKFDQGS